MLLAVIGATGATGVPLVEQALDAGHEVRALVRTPSKRALLPSSVEVVEGDAREREVLDRLVAGADCVVDVSGPVKGSPDDLRQSVMAALLPAMQTAGIDHLVLLTGAGVRVPGDTPGLLDRAIRWLMSKTVPEVLEDGVRAVEMAQDADLAVTVVRAPRLQDGRRGEVTVVPHVGQGHSSKLGRGDLAEFLLQCATERSHVGAAPVVSW